MLLLSHSKIRRYNDPSVRRSINQSTNDQAEPRNGGMSLNKHPAADSLRLKQLHKTFICMFRLLRLWRSSCMLHLIDNLVPAMIWHLIDVGDTPPGLLFAAINPHGGYRWVDGWGRKNSWRLVVGIAMVGEPQNKTGLAAFPLPLGQHSVHS